MNLKVQKLEEGAVLPERAHPGDSGLDIRAHSFKKVYIHGGGNGERLLDPENRNNPISMRRSADAIKDNKIDLNYLERVLVGTGIKVAVPKGYEVQVRPRSGLALKEGITVLNTPGTIDSGYRDEVCVILVNLSRATKTISLGDRIAQLVVKPVEPADVELVPALPEPEDRGENGFGSTGK